MQPLQCKHADVNQLQGDAFLDGAAHDDAEFPYLGILVASKGDKKAEVS